MKRFLAAGILVALGVTAVLANPIEDRQALMKQVAAATRTGAGLAKGETPFDAAKAQEILQVYVRASEKLPGLFPDDSKIGGDTTAAPKIWEDMAGFRADAAKLGADAKAAMAATDQASFAKGFGEVTRNCGACHGAYRIKKG
jgi:cytochrome c556